MRTARTPPDRRRVACSSMTTRSAMASSGCKADRFRRSPNPYEIEDDDASHPAIADWFDQRLGARATLEPMIAHPVPRTTASWWYVFGSATLSLFVLQIVTGICLALVYVPTADQAYQSLEYLNYQAPLWLVPPCPPLLGFKRHGAADDAAPDPGLPLGCAQVSARVDVDRRRVPLAVNLGHGVHRPGPALGPGCLLGAGDWRLHRRPSAADRPATGRSSSWGGRSSPAGPCRAFSRCTCSSFRGC